MSASGYGGGHALETFGGLLAEQLVALAASIAHRLCGCQDIRVFTEDGSMGASRELPSATAHVEAKAVEAAGAAAAILLVSRYAHAVELSHGSGAPEDAGWPRFVFVV